MDRGGGLKIKLDLAVRRGTVKRKEKDQNIWNALYVIDYEAGGSPNVLKATQWGCRFHGQRVATAC